MDALWMFPHLSEQKKAYDPRTWLVCFSKKLDLWLAGQATMEDLLNHLVQMGVEDPTADRDPFVQVIAAGESDAPPFDLLDQPSYLRAYNRAVWQVLYASGRMAEIADAVTADMQVVHTAEAYEKEVSMRRQMGLEEADAREEAERHLQTYGRVGERAYWGRLLEHFLRASPDVRWIWQGEFPAQERMANYLPAREAALRVASKYPALYPCGVSLVCQPCVTPGGLVWFYGYCAMERFQPRDAHEVCRLVPERSLAAPLSWQGRDGSKTSLSL